jgi:heavy metal sensor kinase
VLQVGRSLTEADRTLRLLLTSLLITGGLSLMAAVRGGAWLARRALEPVAEIAATAQQIVRADDLSRRVRAVPTDDEIGQLATTINDMLGRLDQLFTAQQRFVADLSHELRTPLAAMRGHLEMIRRGASHDPAVLAESLPALEREAARLARMTSDLLTLAQAENGLRIQHARVALDELVLDVVRDLRPLSNGVALMPSIDEQVQAPGDPDRLKQALVNLVANALQHTPAGGTVRVGLVRAGGQALLQVRDTGAGIAAEDLPHIFERFYRADKARTRRQGGAGLGLAIVSWVAEAHGGRVTVESAPGQGSTFTLALPLE